MRSRRMWGRRWLAAAMAASLVLASVGAGAAPVIAFDGATPPDAPVDLSTNDRERPLEVEGAPLFGWFPQDQDGNEIQTAYQIVVHQVADGATIWDSGKVESSDQAYVPYGGPPLTSDTSYGWTVRTWDRTDQASPYADPVFFDTGISDAEWSGANWIRRATTGNDSSEDWTLARKQFLVSDGSPVVRARAYVAAMAQYDLHVNGESVYRGDSFTYPGEGYYQSSDITEFAAAGEPLALGVLYHYWTCTCQGRANGPSSPNGPSGLLVKVVVDHADGTKDVFVTDGTWRVRKATEYTNATLTTRNGDAGDRVERYDARNETVGWDTIGFDDTGAPWVNATVIGPHPRPTGFTHLNGGEHRLEYETIYPVSVQTLPDGSIVADFGQVISAMPGVHYDEGVAGRAVTVQTSYRLGQTTLAAPASAGDTNIKVASTSNFAARIGAQIEIDSWTAKEVRSIVAVGTSGAGGTGVTLDAPLGADHAAGRTVWSPTIGTATADTQGSNLSWFYTQKAGPQTSQAFTYWAWRYLRINAPGPGETIEPGDIFAVTQHSNVDASREATFASDDPVLDEAFAMMKRSGLWNTQEVMTDTPTREKGQFLGDAVDISMANMVAYGERDATQRAIREFVYSQIRWWDSGSNFGRLNAVYPNGDGRRDIPDYTEMFPGWVMYYYHLTGDRSLVEHAYPTMLNIGTYIYGNRASTGNAAGMVYNLPGGSGQYQFGIIDWPAQGRYTYVRTNNGAQSVVNAIAVGAFNAITAASDLLGNDANAELWGDRADVLAGLVHDRLWRESDRRYVDGLSTSTGNPQLSNASQHAQTYQLYYGIAPEDVHDDLETAIVSKGMQQGPMTWHILLKSLAILERPDQIVNLITNPAQDGPAKILAQDGTHMWEAWNVSGAESHSHGWGAWGLLDVVETLLGVEVTGTGASSVRIAPPRSGIGQASGSAWTQRGAVAVEWVRAEDGTYTLSVAIPVNQTAIVALPVHPEKLYIPAGDGAPEYLGIEGDRHLYQVGSGTTTFVPDLEAPELTVPDPITVDATGPDGTVVTFEATATDNFDPDPVVECTPPSGSVFAIGTTTVTCSATDDSSNVTEASFAVHVKSAEEQLADLLADVQGVGPGTSLSDMVVLAQGYEADRDIGAACTKLADFINLVTAQAGKKISLATAADLVADATRIRAVLDCP